jgi:two-component system, LuxR family, sensor kinase FixL
MHGDDTVGTQAQEQAGSFIRTALWVLFSGACYYLTTKIAWALCFPNSKVSLFFPPHAVLVSILLLVPTRHWWAYTLASICGHLLAAQQAHWPLLYSLHCEAFDAVQNLGVAAGIRLCLKSPLKFVTLREAVVFVLIAVILVPFGTAFWGAAFTISNGFGTDYWIEWRNLGISNAVTAIVLVPAILLGVRHLSRGWIKVTAGRLLEAGLLGAGILIVVFFAFDKPPAGPDTSPALLYAPIPLLIWAVLRFGLGGMSAAMLVITFQAIWGTMHGRGPFLMQTPAENALALQLFLLVTASPLLFLAVVIEEDRRSRSALRESEVRFRNVADTAPVLIWMSGMNKEGVFFNKSWLEFTGRTVDQELGEGWLKGVHAADLAHCLDVFGVAFEKREPFTIEFRLRRKDGEYRWVLDVGTPRFEAGIFLGYIGSCLDITERRQAELDHQVQSTELARVGRVALMGELAASLAHEVNNPLGAMVTNASAGQRLLARGQLEPAELRELLADIVSDGHRAREVIEGIRNMVRKSEASHSLVGINDVIRDLLRIVRADAIARNISLVAEVDAKAGIVLADRVQLLQVLLNLTLNAFEALSVIRADVRHVVIRAEPVQDGKICVSVRDTGPGFPDGLTEQLFEAFFSTKAEGTGMGLAIARSIIEAHGGTLTGENGDTGGARFTVCLPEAAEGEVILRK